jgi:hypothetical protein
MLRSLRVARCVGPALLIAGYTLLTSWTIASTQLGPPPPGRSDHIEHDVRYQGLRDALAALRVDTVGYVHAPRRQDSVTARNVDYFQAQYALAPVVVRKSTQQRYVVGDFRSRRALESYLERTPLALVARYGKGVALLRNDSAP